MSLRALKLFALVTAVSATAALSTGCGLCCSLLCGGGTPVAMDGTRDAPPAEIAPKLRTQTAIAQAH